MKAKLWMRWWRIGEREFDRGDAALVQERKVTLIFRLEVMEGDPRKIRNDNVTRDVLLAFGIAGEVMDVAEGLGLRLGEILAKAFVLDNECAGPEEVDVAVVAGDFFDRFFEGGDGATPEAENGEELVPEGFGFGMLSGFASPFFGETDGVVADFVPGDWHAEDLAELWQPEKEF